MDQSVKNLPPTVKRERRKHVCDPVTHKLEPVEHATALRIAQYVSRRYGNMDGMLQTCLCQKFYEATVGEGR